MARYLRLIALVFATIGIVLVLSPDSTNTGRGTIYVYEAGQVTIIPMDRPGMQHQMRPGKDSGHYSVSGDGKWIAYSDVVAGQGAIWVQSLADATRRKVADLPFSSERIVGQLAWSYDMKQLAFLIALTDQPFHEQLAMLDVRGGALHYLTGPVQAFAWSPRATRIAAYPAGVESGSGLYLIDPEEDIFSRLCKAQDCLVSSMAWSPNGTQLAIRRGNEGETVDFGSVATLDINKKTMVALLPAAAGARLGAVAWSPDGKRLGFCNRTASLYVMDWDNGNLRQVGERVYQCGAWSPDGTSYVYARDDTTGTGADISQRITLVEVRVADGATTTVAPLTPGVTAIEWR